MTNTFTDGAFNVSTDWILEFDWSCVYNTSNSNVVFATNAGNVFKIEWEGSNAVIKDYAETPNTLTSTLPHQGSYTSKNQIVANMDNPSHFTVLGVKDDGIYLTVKKGEETYVNNVKVSSTFSYPKSFSGTLARYYSSMAIDNITFKTPAVAGFVATPTSAITGAYNKQRKFTLSCLTDGATIYYADSDLEIGADGWTEYPTSAVTTSSATIYAYASDGTNNSEKMSFATGAGTTLSLATPTISATGFTNATGISVKNPTFNFSCDNSEVLGTPTATLSYTFTPAGGSESTAVESNSYTPGQYGTLKVIASAEGYNPSEKSLTVSNVYTVSYSGRDYATATHEDTFTTWGNGYSVTWDGWASGLTAYLSSDAITDDNHLNIQNTGTISLVEGWGLVRGDQKAYGYRVRYANEGDFIALKENTSKGNDATATTYQTAYCNSGTGTQQNLLTISVPGGYAVQQLYHYSPVQPTLADGDAVKLTFNNATAGTGTAYGENFKIDFYNSSSTKVANVRADWWDDVAGTNNLYTYGYTYSSDGGATADNTNVWSTYMSDMTNAVVDLTMSYSDGTLYVIGTMTNNQKVYYVNYMKSGLEGDLTYNLYGNNATLSNITTTSTSAITAPAHPTNVAVTLGSNGYTTYANNVYPLDLTNATAYKASVSGDKVNFTLFKQAVPASTGMLVGGSGTVNLPIADASTAVEGNEFLVNTSGAVFNAEENTTYYAMLKDSNPLAFGTFNPGSLAFPATKAYLKVAHNPGAKALTAFFDGDVTGISKVENGVKTSDNTVYNLAGQRVIKPTKGLYIVNGKKVIVK